MYLEELGTIIGATLHFGVEGEKTTCSFPDVQTKIDETAPWLRCNTTGIGYTSAEAMNNYAEKLRGRWLVYKSGMGLPESQQFQVPTTLCGVEPEPTPFPVVKWQLILSLLIILGAIIATNTSITIP